MPLARNPVAGLLLWVGLATSVLVGYLTARDLRSGPQLVFQRNVDDIEIGTLAGRDDEHVYFVRDKIAMETAA